METKIELSIVPLDLFESNGYVCSSCGGSDFIECDVYGREGIDESGNWKGFYVCRGCGKIVTPDKDWH